MLGSKNDFFKQKSDRLTKSKYDMLEVLSLLDRNEEDKLMYLDAYNYFIGNPDRFDGATVMRDLFILKHRSNKLDIDAMLHDYEYITGANKNFKKKFKADLRYFNNMLLNGKGVQLFRFVILVITSPFFVYYNKIKNKLK